MQFLRRILDFKFHPGEIISPLRKKYLLIPHICFSILTGLGLLLDQAVREASAIVQIFDWLSPTIMGVGFIIAFVCGVFTLFTGSWRTYVITNLLVLFLSCSWMLSLFVIKFFTHTIPVSMAGFGVWLFIATDCIVIASIHNRVISTKTKV